MSARDLSSAPDDALIAGLHAGLGEAPESELLAAADTLTRIHPTPAPAAQPVAYQVTRFNCPFCRRYSRSRREPVAAHIARCWLNPAARACLTCAHFRSQAPEPEVAAVGVEFCEAQQAELDDIHDGCPLWQSGGRGGRAGEAA